MAIFNCYVSSPEGKWWYDFFIPTDVNSEWLYHIQSRSRHNDWLAVLTILKNMKVNGKDDIPYIMENKTYLKQPTKWQCWVLGTSNFRSPGPHTESAANLRSPTTFSAEFSNRTLEQDLPIFSPQFRVPCRKNQPKDVWSKPPGWWFQPLLKILVMGRIIPYIMENNKCSKPPTSLKVVCTSSKPQSIRGNSEKPGYI